MTWWRRKTDAVKSIDWKSLHDVRSILQDQDAMMDAWQQDLTTVANSIVDWMRTEYGVPIGVNIQLFESVWENKNKVIWLFEFIFPKDIHTSLSKVTWFQNYFLPNVFAGTKNLAWRVTYNV